MKGITGIREKARKDSLVMRCRFGLLMLCSFAFSLTLTAFSFAPAWAGPSSWPESSVGWYQDEGGWWYQDSNGWFAQGWKYSNGHWYYLGLSGYMETGWYKVEGEWNWSDASGVWFPNTWRHDDYGWWYEWADGTYPVSSWQLIEGKWYLFDGSGYMLTGWQFLDGTWYYLNSSGDMARGWKHINGAWYWLGESGDMATGWEFINGDWYYLNPGGDMASGWKNLAGYWYYLDSSGAMLTDWQEVGGALYYLSGSGEMLAGVQTICGVTYRFDASGAWIETIGDKTAVEIEVVDRVYALDQWGNRTWVTKNTYDEKGRVVRSDARPILPRDNPSKMSEGTTQYCDYDSNDRITGTATYYGRWNWSLGEWETFAYGKDGFCSTYTLDTVDQGGFSHTVEYRMDEGGCPTSSVETDIMKESWRVYGPYSAEWGYLENGKIEKVVVESTSDLSLLYPPLLFSEKLSIPANGRYTYECVRPGSEFQAKTIRFNEDGKVQSVEDGAWRNVYVYKTIRVDIDSFVPSVYSNPTGYPIPLRPSLSNDEIGVVFAQ